MTWYFFADSFSLFLLLYPNVVHSGILLIFLGMLAAKYEKLGGEVKWMGKPDKVNQNSHNDVSFVNF